MKRRNRLTSVICLLLILCMLFTSCKIEEPDINDPDDPTIQGPGNDKPGSNCTHANTSLQNVKAATCAEAGWSGDYVCTACSAIVTPGSATPKLDHSFDSGRTTKEPTCIEEGVKTYTCTGCGTTKVEPIPTVAHDDKYHDVLDGTHLHTCTKCPLNDKEQHTPVGNGTVYGATCSEDGYTEYTCADCAGVYKVYSATDTAKGHSWSTWEATSQATCEDEGEKTQHCLNGCDTVNTVTTPVSNNHRMAFSYYSTTPSCNGWGTAIYECRDCEMENYKEIAPTGVHNYQTVGDAVDGWVTKCCSGCGNETRSFDSSLATKAELNTSAIDKSTSLEMNMESSAILFPQEVVNQIASGSDVSISADVLDDTAKDNAISNVTDAEQRELLLNAPIYDFTVTVDSQVFSENFSEPVAITVPYTNDGGESDAIVIYYLANNGEIEEITDVSYNEQTGMLTFFVSHFSYYAVAYRETQDMRCRRGVHDFVPTDYTEQASCYSFGYTVYECTNCHDTTLDDITARLDHNYGELIPAQPSCERGDYVKRICQNDGCGSVLEVSYVGATGHVMDAPATCTTSCTCTVCGKVLSRPLGHSYTEWETVVAPGEATNGIKRRYCTVCGKVDETTIASSGTVEALEYATYTELLHVLLDDLIGFTGGEISFTYLEEGRNEIAFDVTVQKTQRGYRMILDGTDTRYTIYPDLIDRVYTFEFYYDNGVFVAIEDDDYAYASELDNLIPSTVEVLKNVLAQLHDLLDPFVNDGLAMARETLDEYLELLGDDIDAALSAAGSDYTAEQLKSVIDAAETVYAYLSLKLGLATEAEIAEGIVLPTREDIYTVLSAFMSVSEKDGITTYTLSAPPILEEVRIILDYVEDHEGDTIAEYIFLIIGNKAKEFDSSLTDFNAIIDFIATEFPGTLTLSDAIDKLVLLDENSDAFSLDSLYEVINTIVGAYYGEEFDVEAMLSENGEMTLDEFIGMLMEEKEYAGITEALYSMIKENAAEATLGELYLYRVGGTVAELRMALLQLLDNTDVTGTFSFSVDGDGRIVGAELDHELFAHKYFDPSEDLLHIESVKVSIKHKPDTVVEIPTEIKPLLVDIETYYDENGNLVIKGLSDALTYSFGIEGYGAVDFDEVLEFDAEASLQLGYNVYVIKPEYWGYESSTHLIKYNGSYYYDSSYSSISVIEWYNDYTVEELIANPSLFASESSNLFLGYLMGTEGEVSVYESPFGIAYKLNGEWMVSSSYGNQYGEEYYVYSATSLDELLTSLAVVSAKNDGSGYFVSVTDREGNEERVPLLNLTLTGGFTALGYQFDGTYYVMDNDYDYSYKSIYRFDNPVTLPEYDRMDTNVSTRYILVNGELTEVVVTNCYLYNKVPSYFVKVADGVYADLEEYQTITGFDTDSYPTLALPGGSTLYVLGWSYDTEFSYENADCSVAYGYVQSDSGRFHRTIAVVENDTVVEVLYYSASEMHYFNFDRVYNVEAYTSVDKDSNYVISKQLIETLKGQCYAGDSFFFTIEGEGIFDGLSAEFMYAVGSYMEIPELSLNDIGAQEDPFYKLFDKGGYGEDVGGNGYSVVKNSDGSISLVFGGNIYNIYYQFNNMIPADSMLKYDEQRSEDTGLEIYTYETKFHYHSGSPYLVYRNGSYYYLNTDAVYDLTYASDICELLDGWYVNEMYYQFDTVENSNLPAGVKVYNTTIIVPYDVYYYGSGYINLYTFVTDGQLYAAYGAETTGDSMLTFEGYMPIEEYMDSLIIKTADNNYLYTQWNINNTVTDIYKTTVHFFESDGNGNILNDSCVGYINDAFYVMDGDVRKYIIEDRQLGSVYSIGSEYTPTEQELNGERNEYIHSYLNGSVNVITFSYQGVSTSTYEFIKLAGKFYEYDYNYNWWNGTYLEERLDEWEFNEQALDKKWCYAVIDSETSEYTYYTEFIPSDYGFEPAGEIIDPATFENAYDWTTTTLGYTSDGDELVELSYYVSEGCENFEYTVEEQSDGTVFYHVNGIGFLKDQAGYYVRARKVTYGDGSTGIVCMLRSAIVYDEHLDEIEGNLLDKYFKVSGNTITLTEELLELASHNKNNFYVRVYSESYGSLYIDYYQLETLFMMAEDGKY